VPAVMAVPAAVVGMVVVVLVVVTEVMVVIKSAFLLTLRPRIMFSSLCSLTLMSSSRRV
jgi:hypothetical protein